MSDRNEIHMATVSAPTNIACIKYWGKASIPLNTPINSSLSVTLDQDDLRAVTTASASLGFQSDRLWLNGIEEEGASTSKRFRACVDRMLELAGDKIDDKSGSVLVAKSEWKEMRVHISSYNTFPTAAGLASSAAGYAALVYALAKLFCAKESYKGQFTAIARQGSGSACRSLYGGFVAWRMGSNPAIDGSDSIAQQVADENHWPQIRAVILVVSDSKKDTSSTAGMSTSVQTSELLKHRAHNVVPKRMADIEKAIAEKDFDAFGRITMMDSNQFHATCLDTYPPIFYMNHVSKLIVRMVHVYNDWAGGTIRAAYTFDAGPNAVLYTLDQYQTELCALMLHYFPSTDHTNYINNNDMAAQARDYQLDEGLIQAVDNIGIIPQTGDVKNIYCTKAGPGPQTLGMEHANIDIHTGFNTYKPH
mmetsp:Transcript_48594/g.72118  ORF Transcript_48594/g.72118 Transcript_48594/m.72118 type:complete len:420 (+) Transcript_48594:39-1298(+)